MKQYLLDTNVLSELVRPKPNTKVINFLKNIEDSLIAATAALYNLLIVTRNTKDFEITGIELFNPWADLNS